MNSIPICITLFACFVRRSAACASFPLLRPGTVWGTSYSPPANATAANSTNAGYAALTAAGGIMVPIDFPWAMIEPVPGQPNVDMFAAAIRSVAYTGGVPYVNVGVIDTNHVSVPPDLVDPNDPTRLAPGLTWVSDTVLDRYAQAIQATVPLTQFYGGFYFGVGNEVDVNLNMHPETAEDFADFVFVIGEWIHNISSNSMAMGVTLTVDGLVNLAPNPPSWLGMIFNSSQATPLTYYPLGDNFTIISDPSVWDYDISTAVSLLPPTACIAFQEIGIPSGYCNTSSRDGSSEAIQNSFYSAVFDILRTVNSSTSGSSQSLASPAAPDSPRWGGSLRGRAAADRLWARRGHGHGHSHGQTYRTAQRQHSESEYGAGNGRVRAVMSYEFVDMASTDCLNFERYYNITNPNFVEYLCSLGVFFQNGTAKSAFQTFVNGVAGGGLPQSITLNT